MKKLLSFALAAAFLISAPSLALAKEKGEKGKGGMAAGKVTAVDTTAKTITVQHGKAGEAKTFKVDDSTKITVDGKEAKLADITSDMHAKLTAGRNGGHAASDERGLAGQRKNRQ